MEEERRYSFWFVCRRSYLLLLLDSRFLLGRADKDAHSPTGPYNRIDHKVERKWGKGSMDDKALDTFLATASSSFFFFSSSANTMSETSPFFVVCVFLCKTRDNNEMMMMMNAAALARRQRARINIRSCLVVTITQRRCVNRMKYGEEDVGLCRQLVHLSSCT